MSTRESIRADAPDRERILSVAAKMFREEGFERTGLRDIAKACDMLPGSLHYRYRAKEDILIDMMRLAIERTIRAIVDATMTVQDPLQKMRAALQALHPFSPLTGSYARYAETYRRCVLHD